MALVATGGLLGSQLVVGIIAMYNPSYHVQAWHQFLIYIAYNVVAMLLNAFGNSILPYVNKVAITWSIGGFAIICIAVLACASPHYDSGEFVYGKFINTTGWPDGLAWLLGLLQGALGLTGYDATAHMVSWLPSRPFMRQKCLLTATLRSKRFQTRLWKGRRLWSIASLSVPSRASFFFPVFCSLLDHWTR